MVTSAGKDSGMIHNPYWLGLRWFLLGWVLVSILGAISISIIFSKQTEVHETSLKLQQQLNALAQQINRQATYQREASFYFSNQARWQRQGLSKEANPALWVSSWMTLQQQTHLSHMQFDIQPPKTCGNAACNQFFPGNTIAGLSMTVTPVNMHWSVNHEAEVLDWLQQLQHQYADMLLVHSCTWSVAESTDLIAAECELRWFNFPDVFPQLLSAS
jgi:hypothetical protein